MLDMCLNLKKNFLCDQNVECSAPYINNYNQPTTTYQFEYLSIHYVLNMFRLNSFILKMCNFIAQNIHKCYVVCHQTLYSYIVLTKLNAILSYYSFLV
jgi:hypothetical protein